MTNPLDFHTLTGLSERAVNEALADWATNRGIWCRLAHGKDNFHMWIDRESEASHQVFSRDLNSMALITDAMTEEERLMWGDRLFDLAKVSPIVEVCELVSKFATTDASTRAIAAILALRLNKETP